MPCREPTRLFRLGASLSGPPSGWWCSAWSVFTGGDQFQHKDHLLSAYSRRSRHYQALGLLQTPPCPDLRHAGICSAVLPKPTSQTHAHAADRDAATRANVDSRCPTRALSEA